MSAASAVSDVAAALAEVKGVQLTPEETQAAQLLAGLITGLLDKQAAKVESDAAAGITNMEAAEASAGKR